MLFLPVAAFIIMGGVMLDDVLKPTAPAPQWHTTVIAEDGR